jgi:predicted nuclease of predicted toxin-antitoxin system
MRLSEIELWLDMQLSPALAKWIVSEFSVKATSSYDLFMNNEKDETIFLKAKEKGNVILLSKLERLKHPPKLVWLTMGNCPNKQMKIILQKTLLLSLKELINTSTTLVEIT